MSVTTHHTIPLPGCTPEPLMNYLKALGILRLVGGSSSGDTNIRGCWVDGIFTLETTLAKEALEEFFLKTYVPTPIVVPWSGSDFFDVKRTTVALQFTKTPAGANIIAAFAATTHPRFAPYRAAITSSLDSLRAAGIEKKEQMKGEAKSRFLSLLRGSAESQVADWIDAAAVIEQSKPVFTAMLGSGGGSDGNTHFSDNFMQNLWDVFPEFDSQRYVKAGAELDFNTDSKCLSLLRHALYGTSTTELAEKRTSSLFDSGAVGGPNAGQGFERDAIVNPWNFILAVEGAMCFAGALCRRTGVRLGSAPAFPFQVHATPNAAASVVEKEQAGKELWLPIWERPATAAELLQVFAEGRMQTGNRAAASGVDAARAVASLGIDRGLLGFQRFAILRGRVGGENYNTAAGLGLHLVRSRRHVDLVREVDRWLSTFRVKCFENESEEDRNKGNARLTSALRRIERAIFDYCQHGGAAMFQRILISLGRAEALIASAPRFREEAKGLRPIALLTSAWIEAANDQTDEFRIALALASIFEPEPKVGSIRRNLEPVEAKGRFMAWAEKDRAVVWTGGNLSGNLAAILARRAMDAERTGGKAHALKSGQHAPLSAVCAFLAGSLDESRIADLLWGLCLCDSRSYRTVSQEASDSQPLPSCYSLLKLLFLPPDRDSAADETKTPNAPDAQVLALLRANRQAEACQRAAQVLRGRSLLAQPQAMHGHPSRDGEWAETRWPGLTAARLAAALLIPIHRFAVESLKARILRPEKPEAA